MIFSKDILHLHGEIEGRNNELFRSYDQTSHSAHDRVNDERPERKVLRIYKKKKKK